MEAHGDPQSICNEIASELRDIGTWLSSGRLSGEQFRDAVLALEAAKVKRFNFALSGTKLPSGKVRFELRFSDSGELCADLEFDPSSGELETHHHCE